ncbi:MAG: hypothetical protein KGI54_17075 [Pseudomonadota bacterium]|nr:hypothetical protein [Pseudomonadota bacterium]
MDDKEYEASRIRFEAKMVRISADFKEWLEKELLVETDEGKRQEYTGWLELVNQHLGEQ